MTTTTFEEALENFKASAESKGLRWLLGVCTECVWLTETVNAEEEPWVQLLILAEDGRSYQHVPPPHVLLQTMRYFRVGTPEELVGRALWLLMKYGRAYKLFGARELEGY
jgi:hypothetical protein